MKKIITLIGFALFLLNVNGQQTVWVQQGKAPKTEYGNAIEHDNNGYLYITGSFQDSIRLNEILLKDQYGNYCAKYDTSGNVIWANKNMGGSGITFDGNSSIYLFSNSNLKLQKVGLDGTVEWEKTLFKSSNYGSCGIQDVYVKGTDVYVTGFYSGDAYFSNDTLLNSSANWDIFITKFNSSGDFQWANTAGGIGLDKGYAIYVNSLNETYAVGYFKDSANFDTSLLYSNGSQDIYMAKYNSAGEFEWAKNFGGTGFDLAAQIISDDENLYLTGRYKDLITFGSTTLTSSNTDAYIAKFDSNGNALWAKGISGTGNDEEADIDYENGKISFIATTSGNVTLDASILTSLGGLDICIGNLDTAGLVLWSKLMGGTTDDEGGGVKLLNNSTYFNGNFKTTASFDSFSLTSSGIWDVCTGKIDNDAITGVNQIKSNLNELSIYPNPVTNELNVVFDKEQIHSTIILIDNLGNTIREILFSGKQIKLQTEDLNAGMYFITVQDEKKHIVTGKIIKQ